MKWCLFCYLTDEAYVSDSMKKNKMVKPAIASKAAQTLTSSKFERLLTDISASFIDLPHEHVNSAINRALESVGLALGVL